jgi:copper chaperone NosL
MMDNKLNCLQGHSAEGLVRPTGNVPGARGSSTKWFSFGSLFILITLLLVLTACAGNASAELEPPTIHYGEDICEFCGMIISEERYAAGYLTSDGQEHIFDDIGNMIRNHLKNEDEVTAFFVHDQASSMWIRAETAHYTYSEELTTPMLSGLVAFASTEEAADFSAESGGAVLTFDELVANYRQNPTDPFAAEMHHHH